MVGPVSSSAPPPSRTLAEVCARLGVPVPDAPPAPVRRAVLDSRRVRAGDLYAALPGARTHGARFAADAVADGATAVLTDPDGAALAGEVGVPVLVVEDPRARLGPLAAWLAGDPAAALTTIGVTGTNGKTTVTALVEGALTASGARAGLIGTTGTRVAGERLPSARTTPEAPDLQEVLAAMVAAGVGACALEVSSHAAVMHRVDGVAFDVLAFTHLTRDHLDLHGSMEAYFEAKASLFTPDRVRRAVVVVDDAWGLRLAALCRERGVPVTTVSAHGRTDADVRVVPGSVAERADGSSFEVLQDGVVTAAGTTLPGSFNVSNAALAHTVLRAAGMDGAASALAQVAGPPGRMQRVPAPDGAPAGTPTGVVDYAHTPDAVAAALAALRPGTAGDLVVVLGAGGDRDRGKRGAMGAAAAAGADVVVVTDDNPRTEDPAAIRAAVLAGARASAGTGAGTTGGTSAGPGAAGAEVLEVGDRAAAVRAAVARAAARPGSTVLLAGKGHESGQEVGGTVVPFDDVAALAAALAAAPTTGRGARA